MLSHPPGTNDAFAQSTYFVKLQTSSRPANQSNELELLTQLVGWT